MPTPLTNELEKLERITGKWKNEAPQSWSLFEGEEWKEALRTEVEQVKKSFIHEVFSLQDELHLQRYIQFHQQELIRIIDHLQHQQQQLLALDYPSHQATLLSYTIKYIDELLTFIELHFTRYFQQDTKAPESYIAIAGKEVIQKMTELEAILQHQDADPYLIELALNPLRKFIDKISTSSITYRDIIFAKEIIKDLSKITTSLQTLKLRNEELQLLFISLNYNSVSYFNYYTLYLQDQVKSLDSPPDQIAKLSFLMKKINQTQVKQGIGYLSTKTPLKEQLVDWISEEIAYHEKMLQFNQKNISAGTVSNDFKLQTDLSLSQLAYLIRIFIDSNVLQNKNLSELLRIVSRSTQVKKQNIAFDSFRTRYYNPEESTRKSVRSFLLQLVDFINKNKDISG